MSAWAECVECRDGAVISNEADFDGFLATHEQCWPEDENGTIDAKLHLTKEDLT